MERSNSTLYRAYRAELNERRTVPFVRLGALVTSAVNVVFMGLDRYAFPDQAEELLIARILLQILLVVVFLRTAVARPQFSKWAMTLATGGMLMAVLYGTGEPAVSEYYVGLMLFCMGVPVLLPMTALEMVGVSAFAVLVYAAGPWLAGGPFTWREYIMHAIFLAAGGLAGTASAGMLDRVRFRDFVRRRDLERARDELRELDRAKSRFSANVHHELRTPLTLILAPLESVLQGRFGPVPEAQHGYLKTMQVNGARLLRLINNLLDFSKIESQQLELDRRPVHVGRLVADLAAAALPAIEGKGLRLETSGLESLPEVNADLEALEKVFLNLLGNAIKFTEPGGRIAVDGHAADDGIAITVSDDGVGIPEDQLERIFDRFAQADASSTRRHEGTGIGLSLTRELVELHGGRVWAENAGKGCGAVLHVLLPRGEADSAEEQDEIDRSQLETWPAALVGETERLTPPTAELSPSDEIARGEQTKPKVLVVEDNDEMRRYLQALLADEYQVTTARDGRGGFEAARADPPTLVVSDVMMPVMSGTELCTALAGHPRTSKVPVLLLTAKADREMTVEGLQMGARDYVAKPFHPQELLARVKSLVQTEELRKELDQRNHLLEAALFELKETQVQLVQSERLAAAGELAAGVAHEVNNPVNFALNSLHALGSRVEDLRVIHEAVAALDPELGDDLAVRLRGVLRLMQKRDFQDLLPELDELVAIASDGLERTHRLVGDLQGFTGSIRKASLNVREGLESTIRLMRPVLSEGRVRVECEYDPDLPVIHSASSVLNQVFFNLIKNASEAMEGRGGVVRVAAFRDGDAVVVEVSDDGPGISAEVRDRLFEPFVTNKVAGKGSGLGLSICRRILLDLGGTIEVRSPEGEGATFSVRLPIEDPDCDSARAPTLHTRDESSG